VLEQIPTATDGPAATPGSTAAPHPNAEIPAALIGENRGFSLMIPDIYSDLVVVNPNLNPQDTSTLFTLYMKSIYESTPEPTPTLAANLTAARLSETPSYSDGWLFSVVRYTTAEYEQYLSGSNYNNIEFFAVSDGYFYGIYYPTDYQRNTDEAAGNDSTAYLDVQSSNYYVRYDFTTRYELTPYFDGEFLLRKFTYDGSHLFMNYFPNFAKNGYSGEVYTLVLSKPVAKGSGGIWCVERWYNRENGTIHPVFPDADGVSSAEYYAILQTSCDAGTRPDLLNPEQVALDFVRDSHFSAEDVVPGSYEWTNRLPDGVFRYWTQVESGERN
jgi:hypothetical protein